MSENKLDCVKTPRGSCNCKHDVDCNFREVTVIDTSNDIEEQLAQLYTQQLSDKVKEVLQSGQLSTMNLLGVTISLMQTASSFKDLTGLQKKKLVMNVISNEIRESGAEPTLVPLISDIIDTTIKLEKGTITISDVEEVVTGCFAFCKAKTGETTKSKPKLKK